ncbi:MAG: DNA gyrase subunit A [Candidatus Dojkabacteria bacterium]|nr:MAG: DNA gyrase subunit A [Candidatus Dojkabacteria bacterium]
MPKDKTPVPEDVKKLIEEQIAENEAPESPVTPTEESDDYKTATGDLEIGEKTDEGISDLLTTGAGLKAGETVSISITDELKKDFIDYAMSVIVDRAIPDVKDGLKPSQRRVAVAMRDLTLWPTGATRKSAKVVGEAMGNYHPHGDQAIYQTLVNMVQPFTMRYPLVHGQGNFGSIDGDVAASMRYTEAKFSKIAVELLKDIDKGTVLYRVNYDGTRNEPTTLPAAFPNLLANGTSGIAVGMATKIPPHNLGELIDALIAMIETGNQWEGRSIYNALRGMREQKTRVPQILNAEPFEYWENYVSPNDPQYKEKVAALQKYIKEGVIVENIQELGFSRESLDTILKDFQGNPVLSLYPKFQSSVTTTDLMQHIKGPDFPTGGQIYNQKDILHFYETGNGRVKMRGVMAVEETNTGKQAIVITEIPFQVNKAVLMEQIAQLIHDGKIEGVKDLRDESSKNEIRIYIEVKSGHSPQIIMQKLYKFTPLQMNFNANMIALVDDEPRTLTLKRMLELYLEHRMTVFIRKLEFELAQNKYQAHILEGLLKALDFIDEVIKIIRAAKDQEEAKTNLMARFDLTDVQAQAILDMQLRKLAALERQKIQDDYDGLLENIKHHEMYLEKESMILEMVKTDLLEVKEKYADKRRTKVYKGDVDEPQEEDLVANEPTFVTISKTGYIKRVSPEEYRLQHRGGKGSIGAKLKENDYINHVLLCNTHDWLLVFMSDGKVFKLRGYEIPEAKKVAKGLPIVNLLQITPNTVVSSLLSLQSRAEGKFIAMATANGIVKKTSLSEYDNIRRNGLVSIVLKAGDRLVQAQLTTGEDELILVTKKGKSIRFPEKEVKESGRNTMGVKGIGMKKDDQVISFDVVNNNADLLLTVSAKGFGKCTALSEFKQQHRGGSGIYAAKIGTKTGDLQVARIFTEESRKEDTEIILISSQGQVIKTNFKNVPVLGNRQTYGVKVFRVADGDEVIGLAS